MSTRRAFRWQIALLSGLLSLTSGCIFHDEMVVPPPPEGTVPTELNPVLLPRYVIAPPDILYIQVLQPPYNHYLPSERPKPGVDPAIENRAYFSNPLTPAPIDGQHLVQLDGTVDLGIYGSVQVAGLTTDQARERIRSFILAQTERKPDSLQVRVSVLSYNSKPYYVITDGAGYGEQVYSFPITGSENVLDAIARIGGLPQVASKRRVWIARRSPNGGQDQLLSVCWEDITQRGITRTNYQVLPGDRIYVHSQKIIQTDVWLQKALQPIERLLGVTLLGANTVQTIEGRNLNNQQ